ncbi:MAG: DNA-binding protein WhiA [Clostridia bacterium]|nr:DNA-binding protein WhiA [Clostridia bacterium]
MSFSSDVKEELSQVNNLKDKEALKAEFLGYLLTWKMNNENGNIEFLTENEFNVERFYKILFNLGLNYEPETYGKYFKTTIFQNEITNEVLGMDLNAKTEILRTIVKGAFMSTGSVNNPEKQYHLEISFIEKKNAEYILNICKTNGVNLKILESKNKYILYIKEGEEISKFLALIGANKAVMKFEDIRAEREIKNNVNRKVNCETANLNKTINASVNQINDIKLIQNLKKFEELSEDLKVMALLRLEYPDLSLKELGELLEPPLGKSGVNHRLKKIHEFAEELRR